MPELPEVETVARGLHRALVGQTITGVAVHWPRTVAVPAVDEFRGRIAGRQVRSVSRRGKYLVVRLDQGYLLIHLKMSGRLHVVPAQSPPGRHLRACFDLEDGRQLRFYDARKFGRLYLVADPAEVTGGLGPEPLAEAFTLEEFVRRLGRRTGRLKPLLLDQSFLAGVGNIYADEVLFAARLHPLRRADSLGPDERARLYEAIRTVLAQAVAGGGTTLEDGGYADVEGRPGSYQEQVAVYGRAGAPCRACGTPIERLVIGGRSSHFCPGCQK